jgi:hypothetical protein
MSPRDIAHKAKKIGLDMVALTDHNSALNCHAFREACNNDGGFILFSDLKLPHLKSFTALPCLVGLRKLWIWVYSLNPIIPVQ